MYSYSYITKYCKIKKVFIKSVPYIPLSKYSSNVPKTQISKRIKRLSL